MISDYKNVYTYMIKILVAFSLDDGVMDVFIFFLASSLFAKISII